MGGLVVWMLSIGRARHPGPARGKGVPGRLSVEFVNVGREGERRRVAFLW